jgi:inner membrane protein
VNEYLKNTRSAKYAILVIGLTFMLYFFFEVLRKLFIHPFQYLLVGLALTVFYLLLLSLSEHLGFNAAYLVSAFATIALICGYSHSVLKIKRLVLQLFGLLVAIYGFIFVLLQLEDFALLAGSIGVFIALAAVMHGSRKVDWYNLGSRSKTAESDQPVSDNNDNN